MEKNSKIKKQSKRIPKKLQGILWSKNVKNLDLEKNKIYIIHQLLMYGDLDEMAWLLKTYSKKEIRRVFEQKSMKIHTPQCFNFIKNIVLGLKKKSLSPKDYVKTLY